MITPIVSWMDSNNGVNLIQKLPKRKLNAASTYYSGTSSVSKMV